ncbi:MAG TPA: TonB-dependent receptor plug domain-containing protein, partial [Sphingomonadaceae bacterium]|nr:TonB-dependent receptor plug domain-containing protein [Sphingomonadaceae bacterium]
MGRHSTLARGVVGVSVLAMAAMAASVAHAQDSAPAAPDSSQAALGEIVVTAQFRSSKLQETPLAITAISADQLEARSFTNIADVGQTAPSVTLRLGSSGYGKSTQAYIRGVGQYDFNFALEPAVGFYVDDVYHATLFGSTFDLLDLDHVEILRGPQGTLFGKNSIGGAVRLISKKPANDFEASVEGTYGSYERIDLRGMINVPLIDDVLALRVSGVSKQRNGYVDRIDYACAFPSLAGSVPPTVTATGGTCKVGTLGGESVRAGRAALRFTPSSAVEINLVAEVVDDNSEGAADSLIYVNTNAPSLQNFNQYVLIPNYGIPFDNRFATDPYVSYANYANLLRGRPLGARREHDAFGKLLGRRDGASHRRDSVQVDHRLSEIFGAVHAERQQLAAAGRTGRQPGVVQAVHPGIAARRHVVQRHARLGARRLLFLGQERPWRRGDPAGLRPGRSGDAHPVGHRVRPERGHQRPQPLGIRPR